MTYTPDADALGEDTFTYTAADGTADSPAATATITLTGPPRCADVSRRTRVETAVAVPLTCVDPDDDILTLSIVDAPSKGTLGAISGGSVTYTPNAGDAWHRLVHLHGDRRRRPTRRRPPRRSRSRAPPTCDAADAKTAIGEPVTEVPLACTDPDGDALTLEKVAGPMHGTLGASTRAREGHLHPDAGYSAPTRSPTAPDGDRSRAP